MSKTAMKLALEALESQLTYVYDTESNTYKKCFPAITALREALAEQPQESPKFDPNESFAREEAAQARVREFMRNH